MTAAEIDSKSFPKLFLESEIAADSRVLFFDGGWKVGWGQSGLREGGYSNETSIAQRSRTYSQGAHNSVLLEKVLKTPDCFGWIYFPIFWTAYSHSSSLFEIPHLTFLSLWVGLVLKKQTTTACHLSRNLYHILRCLRTTTRNMALLDLNVSLGQREGGVIEPRLLVFPLKKEKKKRWE